MSIIALGISTSALCMAAQSHLKSVSGTVRDRQNRPVSGAVIKLEDENTQAIRTYLSDGDGHYNFKRVSGDIDYRLWATYRGRQSKSREISKFSGKTAPAVTLHIK